ncbi:MAG: ABC transporter ATP-binding protein [Ancrocorticia sp.]
MSIISIRDLHKTYEVNPPVMVLQGVDLEVETGERLAIVGNSGAGKSTLLNIIGLLDAPTSGSYQLGGEPTETMRGRDRDRLRANALGFVFQDSHVLGQRTVAENLELKLAINRIPRARRLDLMTGVLDDVGLRHRSEMPARLLSGGEKQRLAIARAIMTSPRVLLADEPTGNLDRENSDTVLRIFDEQAGRGVAVVVITHDERLAAWADRVCQLRAGRIVGGGEDASHAHQ